MNNKKLPAIHKRLDSKGMVSIKIPLQDILVGEQPGQQNQQEQQEQQEQQGRSDNLQTDHSAIQSIQSIHSIQTEHFDQFHQSQFHHQTSHINQSNINLKLPTPLIKEELGSISSSLSIVSDTLSPKEKRINLPYHPSKTVLQKEGVLMGININDIDIFKTGDNKLDHEHDEIFITVNLIKNYLNDKEFAKERTLSENLKLLFKKVTEHFMAEETDMLDILKGEECTDHINSHRNFLNWLGLELRAMNIQINTIDRQEDVLINSPRTKLLRLKNFLINFILWFNSHVKTFDIKLKKSGSCC